MALVLQNALKTMFFKRAVYAMVIFSVEFNHNNRLSERHPKFEQESSCLSSG